MRKVLLLLLLVFLFSWDCHAQTVTFIEPGTDATFDTSFYNSGTGTVASASDQAYTGTQSLKFSTGAGPATAAITSPTGILADAGSQTSWYFRFDVLPAATTVIFRWRNSGATQIVRLRLTTAGKIGVTPAGLSEVESTATLSVDTWYRLSLSGYITSNMDWTFRLYVNGTLDTTITNSAGTLTATGLYDFRFFLESTAGTTRNAWVDNVYAATGGASSGSQPDTGNVLCTAKRPISNGTANQFTIEVGAGPAPNGVGTGHAVNVSERPLSATYGWSIGNTVSITEEYNVQTISAGDVDMTGKTIVGVMGWLNGLSTAPCTGCAMMLQGSSSGTVAVGAAGTYLKIGTASYPAGTGTDIGIVTDTTVATIAIYEAGIVFAYRDAVAATGCKALMLGVC